MCVSDCVSMRERVHGQTCAFSVIYVDRGNGRVSAL